LETDEIFLTVGFPINGGQYIHIARLNEPPSHSIFDPKRVLTNNSAKPLMKAFAEK
jgi:hypothetical protein